MKTVDRGDFAHKGQKNSIAKTRKIGRVDFFGSNKSEINFFTNNIFYIIRKATVKCSS